MSTNLTSDVYGNIDSKIAKLSATSKNIPRIGTSYPLGRSFTKKVFGNVQNVKKVDYFNKATDTELIKGMIRQLFLTRRGERVMSPDYGLKLDTFLFEQIDEALFETLKSMVLETVSTYMPYVSILSLRIEDTPDVLSENGLLINLSIQIKEDLSIPPFEVRLQT